MSVATPNRAAFETAKLADHSGVGAAFAAIGSALSHNAQAIIISSSLNTSCWISTNATDNQLLVITADSIVIDVSGNKQGTGRLSFPKGTQFYVKQGPDGAPASGDISISTIYAR